MGNHLWSKMATTLQPAHPKHPTFAPRHSRKPRYHPTTTSVQRDITLRSKMVTFPHARIQSWRPRVKCFRKPPFTWFVSVQRLVVRGYPILTQPSRSVWIFLWTLYLVMIRRVAYIQFLRQWQPRLKTMHLECFLTFLSMKPRWCVDLKHASLKASSKRYCFGVVLVRPRTLQSGDLRISLSPTHLCGSARVWVLMCEGSDRSLKIRIPSGKSGNLEIMENLRTKWSFRWETHGNSSINDGIFHGHCRRVAVFFHPCDPMRPECPKPRALLRRWSIQVQPWLMILGDYTDKILGIRIIQERWIPFLTNESLLTNQFFFMEWQRDFEHYLQYLSYFHSEKTQFSRESIGKIYCKYYRLDWGL